VVDNRPPLSRVDPRIDARTQVDGPTTTPVVAAGPCRPLPGSLPPALCQRMARRLPARPCRSADRRLGTGRQTYDLRRS